jgi:hypothetical protein
MKRRRDAPAKNPGLDKKGDMAQTDSCEEEEVQRREDPGWRKHSSRRVSTCSSSSSSTSSSFLFLLPLYSSFPPLSNSKATII